MKKGVFDFDNELRNDLFQIKEKNQISFKDAATVLIKMAVSQVKADKYNLSDDNLNAVGVRRGSQDGK